MNAQIERLAINADRDIRNALLTALERARSLIPLALAALLEGVGTDDPERVLAELEAAIGTDASTNPIDDATTVVFGFVAAIAAIAAASVGHILNTAQNRFTASRDREVRPILSRFEADTIEGLRAAASAALQTPGPASSLSAQVIRSIGLTRPQVAALNVMRTALIDRAVADSTPAGLLNRKRQIDRAVALLRGRISSAQIAMVRKAIERPVTMPEIEAVLDRHASALRTHRAQVAAAHMVHAATEPAKVIGWQIAQFFGALPLTMRKVWVTAGDERVRHSHATVPTLNPGGVLLSESFDTPFGKVSAPPLEINCRCRVQLKEAP